MEILIDITTWDSVAAALLRDEIDIGVAPAQTLRSDLKYDFLFDEIHGAYCGQAHPLYGKTFDRPSALAGEAFVLTGADEPDILTAYRTRHGLGPQVAGLSEHLDEAKRLTILGRRHLFPPRSLRRARRRGRPALAAASAAADQPCMPVFVITNPRAPSKLARQLLLAEIGVPERSN